MDDPAPDKITPGKSLEPIQNPQEPSRSAAPGFDSYMGGSKAAPLQAPNAAPTPMEALQPGASQLPVGAASYDSILAQTSQVKDSLGAVEKQLGEKKLRLKRSQSHLVKQKLQDASDHIRSAASKLGMDLPEQKLPSGVSGLTRFLAMVNDGQDQLVQVQETLKKLSQNKAGLNPADLMSVQVKMGLAQQEIQYTSTLLSKVIQSIQQLLNTQL